MYADLTQKICTNCKEKKTLDEYYKYNPARDKRDSWCKSCKKGYVKSYQQGKYKDAKASTNKRYRIENPEKYRQSIKNWYLENIERSREKVRRYQAKKLKATPAWLTKDQIEAMIEIYKSCPEGYEVDHIVPIQGKNICGLHVPWNLQLLSIKENRKKSNKS